MPKPWKVVESRYLLERPWMNVRMDRAITESGAEIPEFVVIENGDWANVVCLDDQERLVLVEQYRHGVRANTWELPAGGVNDDESPLACAQRELLEETGYTAPTWIDLGPFSPETTRHGHRAHLFLALGGKPTHEQSLDSTEWAEVRLFEWRRRDELLSNSPFIHAVHVCALLLAERRLRVDSRNA